MWSPCSLTSHSVYSKELGLKLGQIQTGSIKGMVCFSVCIWHVAAYGQALEHWVVSSYFLVLPSQGKQNGLRSLLEGLRQPQEAQPGGDSDSSWVLLPILGWALAPWGHAFWYHNQKAIASKGDACASWSMAQQLPPREPRCRGFSEARSLFRAPKESGCNHVKSTSNMSSKKCQTTKAAGISISHNSFQMTQELLES